MAVKGPVASLVGHENTISYSPSAVHYAADISILCSEYTETFPVCTADVNALVKMDTAVFTECSCDSFWPVNGPDEF